MVRLSWTQFSESTSPGAGHPPLFWAGDALATPPAGEVDVAGAVGSDAEPAVPHAVSRTTESAQGSRNLMTRRLAAAPMGSPARESHPNTVGVEGSGYVCAGG
jgi:hypothetical protein